MRAFAANAPPGMAEFMKTTAANLFIRPADNLFPLKAGDMQFRFEIVIHEAGIIEGKPIVETVATFRDRITDIVNAFKSCLA
jgi:hypothetical protein